MMLDKDESYCTLRIGTNSFFRFYLDDPYWSPLLSKPFVYEQELAVTSARAINLEFVFVDCGANFGYWSIVASIKEAGARKVVAIEASPETFRGLTDNWNLNQHRFEIINAGVACETGATARVSQGRSHAGGDIGVPTLGERQIGTVETITIDDAILKAFVSMPPRILLKLDIEGGEISALRGTKLAIIQDCLICYEDHGKDIRRTISNCMLNIL